MSTKPEGHTPEWVPSTHHNVPQPAGHECAEWYKWANPDACAILYALAHTKGERDALRAQMVELAGALRDVLADITSPSEIWAEGSSVYRARAVLARVKP